MPDDSELIAKQNKDLFDELKIRAALARAKSTLERIFYEEQKLDKIKFLAKETLKMPGMENIETAGYMALDRTNLRAIKTKISLMAFCLKNPDGHKWVCKYEREYCQEKNCVVDKLCLYCNIWESVVNSI